MGINPSKRIDKELAPLQSWTSDRVKKANARFNGIAFRHNVYGTSCDQRVFKHWLRLDPTPAARLFERFCVGKEQKASSQDVLCAVALLSAAKFAEKIDMCFRLFHTEFEYKLSVKQLRQLTRSVCRGSAVVFGPGKVDFEKLNRVHRDAENIWLKEWGRPGRRNAMVGVGEVVEWVKERCELARHFCMSGTSDGVKIMSMFGDHQDQSTSIRKSAMIRSQSMCLFPSSPMASPPKTKLTRSKSLASLAIQNKSRKASTCKSPWKRKLVFLPTERAPLSYVLDHMDQFLVQSLKVQSSYRPSPLFHSLGIRELRRNFRLLDADKSGTLSVSELTNGHPSIKATVKRIFRKERNHDRQLTFEEFLQILYPNAIGEEKEQMASALRPRPQLYQMAAMDIGAVYRALDDLTPNTFQVRLCDLCAVMARTQELFPYVIHMSRFKRAKLEQVTTFQGALAFLFPKADRKLIKKFAIWASKPELPGGLTADDKGALKKLFKWYDENGDGYITRKELSKCLRKHNFDMINDSMVTSIFRHMDKRGVEPSSATGISYEEFQDFFEFVWVYMDVELFNHFDKLYKQRQQSSTLFTQGKRTSVMTSPLNLRLAAQKSQKRTSLRNGKLSTATTKRSMTASRSTTTRSTSSIRR